VRRPLQCRIFFPNESLIIFIGWFTAKKFLEEKKHEVKLIENFESFSHFKFLRFSYVASKR
jgi:hypothetical protein